MDADSPAGLTANAVSRVAHLEAQHSVDQATIADLEAVAIVDRDVIAHLEADGVIDRHTIANLDIALATARRIGAAIGIIMATRKITEAQAFEVLRGASQERNRKLRDIADDVVVTGTM